MRTHRVCLFLAAVMLLLVALPGATAARIVPVGGPPVMGATVSVF